MTASKSLRTAASWALPAMVSWAVVAALWNFGGVWQLSQGLRAPGPTASAPGGLILLAIAVGLGPAVDRRPAAFLVLTIIAGLAAGSAVGGAFIQDPALWPSESWRWAGIVLNSAGGISAAAAVLAFIRWKLPAD